MAKHYFKLDVGTSVSSGTADWAHISMSELRRHRAEQELESRVRILQYELAVVASAIRGSSQQALDQPVLRLSRGSKMQKPSTDRS